MTRTNATMDGPWPRAGIHALRTRSDRIGEVLEGAVAAPVYEKARAAGLSQEIPSEWFLEELKS